MCASVSTVSLIANEITSKFLLYVPCHDTCVNCCAADAIDASNLPCDNRSLYFDCIGGAHKNTFTNWTTRIFPTDPNRFNCTIIGINCLKMHCRSKTVKSVSLLRRRRLYWVDVSHKPTSSPIAARFYFLLPLLIYSFAVECELLKFSQVECESQSRACIKSKNFQKCRTMRAHYR